MPSLSCVLFEVVVNSNRYFSSGLAYLKHPLAARAASWKPDKISFSLPGYSQISPMANIPFFSVSKFSVLTGICFLFKFKPHSAIGPYCIISPKKPKILSTFKFSIFPSSSLMLID